MENKEVDSIKELKKLRKNPPQNPNGDREWLTRVSCWLEIAQDSGSVFSSRKISDFRNRLINSVFREDSQMVGESLKVLSLVLAPSSRNLKVSPSDFKIRDLELI